MEGKIKMVKLQIINKIGHVYTFKDIYNKCFDIDIEFLDIEDQPQIGEVVFIKEELLNPQYEGYSTSYTFGSLQNKYGKQNILIDDIDIIKLISNEKEIYLKRLYG